MLELQFFLVTLSLSHLWINKRIRFSSPLKAQALSSSHHFSLESAKIRSSMRHRIARCTFVALLLIAVGVDCVIHGRDSAQLLKSSDANENDIFSMPSSRFRAVTVMHRPCSTLSFTLSNFAGVLGIEWPLLVLYDANVTSHVEGNKVVRELKRQKRLHSSSLEAAGFREVLMADAQAYSRVLVSAHFWAMLRAQHVLVFQLDSVLCAMSPWKVQDFLEYDYIGAPWIDHFYGMDIGNGGLSLRKVKTMVDIIKTFPLEGRYENEDIYFARGIYDLAKRGYPVRIPPVHVASKFSFEAGALPRVASFAVHKLPRHKIPQKENVAALFKTCPEAELGVWDSCSDDITMEVMRNASGDGGGGADFVRKAFAATNEELSVAEFENDYDIHRNQR